jgi:hypothetical protein
VLADSLFVASRRMFDTHSPRSFGRRIQVASGTATKGSGAEACVSRPYAVSLKGECINRRSSEMGCGLNNKLNFCSDTEMGGAAIQ